MNNLAFRQLAAAVIIFLSTGLLYAQKSGFDTSRMDKSVDACTDFFEFANGNWLRSTTIPSTESRWGTFNILADNNNSILRKILEDAAKTKPARGSDLQMIGDLYSSCMDEAAINRAGAKPLNPYFKKIASVKDLHGLARELAEMHNNAIPGFFSFGAGPDLKNSQMVIINAGQGGLSLPNRDYYVNDDPKSLETKQKFVEYMVNIFTLLGSDKSKAQAEAQTVLTIQTRMAKASLSQVEMRNPDNRYNKISINDAKALTPDFAWDVYFKQRGISDTSELNFAQPAFFKELNQMLSDVKLDDWKVYMKWMTVNAYAPALAKPYADENFKFFSTHLSGQTEQPPRWKTCVQATDRSLGEALGMQYVKATFKPEAKTKMDELISNLFVAMKGRIGSLEWMSDETKTQAHKKLASFKRKIGYPDVLRGYKGLTIDKSSYLGNLQKTRRFQAQRSLRDIGKPVDRTRWNFSPPTVNASYSSVNNEITFPAGILQPPFFNSDADDAINYGAIGGVIGHEISHGFDDSGSRFDADGNLKMWWTADDRIKFEERAACVVDQFNKYEVQPGLFINGKLTLGENIGDFAGLMISFDAFKRSMEGKPRPANIDGFTPEQRFFLGWAQVWAGKYTTAAERLQVASNSHSLPRWRVNGPLSNMPQFREAFNCRSGQPMVRQNSCSIW